MVERARPLLGTRVAIRIRGMARARANRAIDSAFREVALVHDRMSFQDGCSDVSRLNREASRHPVPVHPYTLEVLEWSLQFAERSHGCFDMTVAAELVNWGLLPRPDSPYRPDPRGSWRDIELRANGTVRFHRPVWIDLSGIAKGYAVDRAIGCLRDCGAVQACVNAGGDLRVLGRDAEQVRLRPGTSGRQGTPVLEIENGSVASSSGYLSRLGHSHGFHGPHVDGVKRRPVGTHSFACVVADRCVVADALTKVALARGLRSDPLLRRYGAIAHLYSLRYGWRTAGAGE